LNQVLQVVLINGQVIKKESLPGFALKKIKVRNNKFY
jgi:hypothetical protein